MKVAVLFNGPPRSGKDTAADYILQHAPFGHKLKFSDTLKSGTHALYGLDTYVNKYEDCKEQPHEDFLGLTPRQAYIDVSEKFMKPQHGKDVFGRILAQRIKRSDANLILVPDSGFLDEALPVIDLLGIENVLLLRIKRGGTSFANDSRSYWPAPFDLQEHDVWNFMLQDFQTQVLGLVCRWLDWRAGHVE